MSLDSNRLSPYEILIRFDLETGQVVGAHKQDVQFTEGQPRLKDPEPIPLAGVVGVMDAACAAALSNEADLLARKADLTAQVANLADQVTELQVQVATLEAQIAASQAQPA
ncbi:hypothetical protein [Sphingomonas sp. ID0503]|uniref:hypothetical protein n=1 Tax=Sphingomonas sp. ID0503 TaxID=3399691 RepID=UPI003AFB642C